MGGGGRPVWKELQDKTSGRLYYVNRETRETTWTKPAELGGGAAAGGTSQPTASASGWVEKTDPASGRKYYYRELQSGQRLRHALTSCAIYRVSRVQIDRLGRRRGSPHLALVEVRPPHFVLSIDS